MNDNSMEKALELFLRLPFFFLGSDISSFHIPFHVLTFQDRISIKYHSRVSSMTRPLDSPIDCRASDRVVPIQAKSHVSINIRTHVAYDDDTEGARNLHSLGNVRHHHNEKLENENYPRRVAKYRTRGKLAAGTHK